MRSWFDNARPSSSTGSPERRPLVIPIKVPRSYGSVLPYYKFVRDTFRESMHDEVRTVQYFIIRIYIMIYIGLIHTFFKL